MTRAEVQAWRLAGDVLLDDPREGDEWGLEREGLASRILDNLTAGRPQLAGITGDEGRPCRSN